MAATLMDEPVQAELARRGSGRLGTVHSVFRTAVNIEADDGRLWSVVARHHPGAPATVVVDVDELGAGMAEGEPVLLTPERTLAVGPITIGLDGAAPRHARTVDGRPDPRAVERLRESLTRAGTRGGLLVDPAASGFAALVGRTAAERLGALSAAVVAGDPTAAASAAAGLVGLGVGLTPAGDDALTGFAVGCCHLGLTAGTTAVRAAVRPGTTHAISLTALRAALEGDATDPLLDLLAAVCTSYDDVETPDAISAALSALVAIGHTSGTDLACGLLAALETHEDVRKAPCLPAP